MNDPSLIGPCADYEHDLVELLEGSLGPERARIVRLHLESVPALPRVARRIRSHRCADSRRRCRTPRCRADFEHAAAGADRALARPANAQRPARQRDREHERLIDTLRRARAPSRAARWHRLGCGRDPACSAAARRAREQTGALPLLLEGPQRLVILGGIGTAVALAALAWTARTEQAAAGRLRS